MVCVRPRLILTGPFFLVGLSLFPGYLLFQGHCGVITPIDPGYCTSSFICDTMKITGGRQQTGGRIAGARVYTLRSSPAGKYLPAPITGSRCDDL